MAKKILILNQKKSTLEIQDEDDDLSFSFIEEITHIERDKTEYGIRNHVIDIFNGNISKGVVTNVKEIKEEW